MTRRLLTSLIWLGLIAVPGIAAAQVTQAAGYVPPDDTPKVAVGGVLFTDYTFTQQPKGTDAAGNVISPNAFNVSRAYINIIGQVSHVVAFRITPDVARETGAGASLAGSLEFRMKYGYMQLNLDDWTGAFKGSWVRMGIQQTPIIDFEEGVYRYRFQSQVMIEREGLLGSADAGASFHSNLPNNYGDFHFGVYNGEGQNKVEPNNEKSFQIRGTLRPFAHGAMVARGLRVTGFYDEDSVLKDAARKRGVFNAMFEHRWFNAGADYIAGKDQALPTATLANSKGWSVWATPFFKQKGNGPELLLRYDDFTPNEALHDASGVLQQRHRTIAGFAFWFPHPGGNATAALLLNYEQTTFPGFANTGSTATQKKIMLNALINY